MSIVDLRQRWMSAALFVAAFFIAAARADTPVAIEELEGDRCYAYVKIGARQPQRVIETAADYAKLFDPSLIRQSCSAEEATRMIVPVDFSRQTVLGAWTTGSCADAGFEHRVLRDDADKLLRYTVIIRSGTKPVCMGPGPESLNLIAIDKVPPGYQVVFDTVHE